jgi:two-component system, NarL family, nitrate/nitrite response regulator NarL
MNSRVSNKLQKGMVLIASAEPELRQRWAVGLQKSFATHEVCDQVDLVHCMTKSKPAVLLLDLDLPQMGEVWGVPAIQRLCPTSRIIVFAGAHNERQAISALKAGAKGYCKKKIEPTELEKAVTVVQKGEVWVGRKIICHLLAELTPLCESQSNEDPPLAEVYLRHLTPREREIALLVGAGASNKEISSRLNISERTVKAHLTAIFYKLQISDRLRLGLFVAGQNSGKSNPPPATKRISD